MVVLTSGSRCSSWDAVHGRVDLYVLGVLCMLLCLRLLGRLEVGHVLGRVGLSRCESSLVRRRVVRVHGHRRRDCGGGTARSTAGGRYSVRVGRVGMRRCDLRMLRCCCCLLSS